MRNISWLLRPRRYAFRLASCHVCQHYCASGFGTLVRPLPGFSRRGSHGYGYVGLPRWYVGGLLTCSVSSYTTLAPGQSLQLGSLRCSVGADM